MIHRQLVTANDLAQKYRVLPETIRQWGRTGRIPVIRLGDGPRAAVRFDPEEVELRLRSLKQVAESRKAQGLPPTVTDPETLAKIAALLRDGDRRAAS